MKYRIRPRETVGPDKKYLSNNEIRFLTRGSESPWMFFLSFFSFFFSFFGRRPKRIPIELTRRKSGELNGKVEKNTFYGLMKLKVGAGGVQK